MYSVLGFFSDVFKLLLHKNKSVAGLFFLALWMPLFASGQNFSSEEELKRKALELFRTQEYVKAMPLYSQLLSLYPKDPEYNFRYGATLIYSDKNKEKPLKYLKYAAAEAGTDPEVHYFLGKAYHLNYLFDDAIKSYRSFNEKAPAKTKEKFNATREIAMCENGKRLVRNFSKLVVLEKKESSREDFFRAYKLGDFGGKIIVKPDDFKSPFDKKKEEKSIIFLPSAPNEIYFASYGDNEKNGKDIFRVVKLPNGQWSKPQSLGLPVNTPYDEDFPFLHPDGNTLYFCSKGHTSMGGYDVFKTVRNEKTNTWETPENLDFPISTPDEDILFITDFDDSLACFASARASIDDFITVYKIALKKRPVEFALIKGRFFDKDDVPLKASITVKNTENNQTVGVFNTIGSTGDYLVNVPNGGKFKFIIESEGMSPQTATVEVPEQSELRPLKQIMELETIDGTPQLVVRNLFDEDISDEEFAFILDEIKKQASLDVNYDPAEEEAIAKAAAENAGRNTNVNFAEVEKGTQAGNNANSSGSDTPGANSNISNKELVNLAYEGVEELKEESKELKEEADFAFSVANSKSELAREKLREAEMLAANADVLPDGEQKQLELKRAAELKAASDKLAKEALAAYKLALNLEADANQKQQEAENNEQYAKELEKAMQSNSRDAIALLEEQKQKLNNADEDEGSGAESGLNSLRKKAADKKAEADDYKNKSQELKQQIGEIEEEIATYQSEIDKTKDKDVKEELTQQQSDARKELEAVKQQSQDLANKANLLYAEAESLEQDAVLVSQMLEEYKAAENNAASTALTEEQKSNLKNQMPELEEQASSSGAARSKDSFADNNASQSPSSPANNADTNSPGNPGTTGDSDVGGAEAVAIFDENGNLYDYGASYEAQLRQVSVTTTPSEKYKAEETINKNWAAAINKEIEYRYGNITKLSKKERSVEEQKIKELEALAAAKSESAAQSAKLAEATLAQNAAGEDAENNAAEGAEAVAVFDENGNLYDYGDSYEAQLRQVSETATPAEKYKAEETINKNWAAAINKEIEYRYGNITKLSKKERRAEEQKIKELEALAAAKSESAAQSAKLAEATPTQNTVSGNDERQNDVSAEAGNSVAANNTATERGGSEEIDYTDAAVEEGIGNTAAAEGTANENNAADAEIIGLSNLSYTSPQAAAEQQKAARILEEAQDFTKQAGEYRAAASEATSFKEKEAALQNALDADAKALEKKNEAVTVIARANQAEFLIKDSELAQMAAVQNKDASAETDAAKQFRQESQNYFNESRQIRAEAEKAESPSDRYSLLKRATEKEAEALAQQQKAIEIYRQQGVELAANSQAAGSNNAAEDDATSGNTAAGGAASNTTSSPGSIESTTINNNSNSTAAPSADAALQKTQRIEEIKAQEQQEQSRGTQLEAEATRLNEEAANLLARAESSKKKERLALTEEARVKKEEAIQKQNEAALAFENARQLEEERTALASGATNAREADLASSSNIQDAINNASSNNSAANNSGSMESSSTTAENNPAGDANTTQGFSSETISDGSSSEGSGTISQNSSSATGNNLNSDAVARIQSSPEFIQYSRIKDEANTKKTLASNESNLAFELRKSARKQLEESQKLITEALQSENEEVKKELMDQSVLLDAQAQQAMVRADLLEQSSKRYYSEAEAKDAEAEQYIGSLDRETADGIASVYNSGAPALAENNSARSAANLPVTGGSGAGNSANNSGSNEMAATGANRNRETAANSLNGSTAAANTSSFVIPNVLTEEIFETNSTITYNDANPIPVDAKLPEGLIFKVQVGAFRNKIPQDLFKGFSPITGESTNAGFTRYTAGFFKSMETAKLAKEVIRGNGYNDAFVVVFYNGKRITYGEAQALMEQGVIPSTGTAVADRQSENNSANTVAENRSAGNTANSLPPDVAPVNPGEAAYKELNAVKGLMYTVQVGVYSKPVTTDQLFNIQPLFVEKTGSSLMRYTSGVFNNITNAAEAKNIIKGMGVQDAFVTAYLNGKRIPVAEAQVLEATNGQGVFVSAPGINKMPAAGNAPAASPDIARENITEREVVNNNEASNTAGQPVYSGGTNGAEAASDEASRAGIIFKVQIGAFREEVPNDIAAIYLRISGKGISHYSNNEGFTVYTLGNFNGYDSANELKNDLVQKEGLTDAFVVAYKNGEKITVGEALDLLKK